MAQRTSSTVFPPIAVSIGVKIGDELALGVIFDPIREEFFLTQRGAGIHLNNARLEVRANVKGDRCLVATGFPFRAKNLTAVYLKAFQDIFYQFGDMRMTGSAALDLAYIAAGRLDAFL